MHLQALLSNKTTNGIKVRVTKHSKFKTYTFERHEIRLAFMFLLLFVTALQICARKHTRHLSTGQVPSEFLYFLQFVCFLKCYALVNCSLSSFGCIVQTLVVVTDTSYRALLTFLLTTDKMNWWIFSSKYNKQTAKLSVEIKSYTDRRQWYPKYSSKNHF